MNNWRNIVSFEELIMLFHVAQNYDSNDAKKSRFPEESRINIRVSDADDIHIFILH